MATRQQIINAARAYLGCRYHHQGRTRAGIDCAGLLVCVAREVGISTEGDQMGYSRTPDGMSLKRALDDFGVRVDTFQPGDFLLMRFDSQPQHIAIVTDVGIIHSYLSARRVVEHRLSDDWRARIVRAYAFPGVE
jgi:cell wall-associated NlpC family hydrolase